MGPTFSLHGGPKASEDGFPSLPSVHVSVPAVRLRAGLLASEYGRRSLPPLSYHSQPHLKMLLFWTSVVALDAPRVDLLFFSRCRLCTHWSPTVTVLGSACALEVPSRKDTEGVTCLAFCTNDHVSCKRVMFCVVLAAA